MVDRLDPIDPRNIYQVDASRRLTIPFYESLVQAGFPNPADNYIRERLNLQDLCVVHPDCTHFVKATGESMVGDYIFPGSILVVDSTLTVETGKVIVCSVNGEWCVKRFIYKTPLILLESSNAQFPPLYVHPNQDQFSVLGVVTYIVSKPPKYSDVRIS